jgi:hypothetical protein
LFHVERGRVYAIACFIFLNVFAGVVKHIIFTTFSIFKDKFVSGIPEIIEERCDID